MKQAKGSLKKWGS